MGPIRGSDKIADPRRGSEIEESGHGPPAEPVTGAPRWVKVFAIIAALIIVALVIALVTGSFGEHGPGRHGARGDTPAPLAWAIARVGESRDAETRRPWRVGTAETLDHAYGGHDQSRHGRRSITDTWLQRRTV